MSGKDGISLPVSPGQRLLWMMEHYRGGNGMLAVPLIHHVRGTLDIDVLRAALEELTGRHDALRTTFRWHRRTLTQTVHPALSWPFAELDDPAQNEEELLTELLRKQIDVTASPVEVTVVRRAPDDLLLVLNVHHLVTDGWSNAVIGRDLWHFYDRLRGIPRPPLPEVGWQYGDFVAWLDRRMTADRRLRHEEFWAAELAGAEVPRLPKAKRPSPRVRPLAENVWFDLVPEMVEALRAVAKRERSTLFTVLLSAYFRVLQRATGQSDLTIASMFAGRPRSEALESVGYFANVVPVRARQDKEGAAEAVAAVRRATLRALEHQTFPFLTLPQHFARSGDDRVEEVMFNMIATSPSVRAGGVAASGLTVEPRRFPDGLGNRFDLELAILPRPGGLEGVFRYADDRFDRAYVDEMTNSYVAELGALCFLP